MNEFFSRFPNCAVWLVGSHMYGLNTANSDMDYAGVYFDFNEYMNPLADRDVTHTNDTNDYTAHSAAKFARLLVKGNFNVIDLVYHDPVQPTHFVSGLLEAARPYAITQNVAKAYMGYVSEQFRRGLKPSTPQNPERKAQQESLGYDAKYIMHMLRGMWTLNEILQTGTYYWLSEADVEALLAVKEGHFTKERVEQLVTSEMVLLEQNYRLYADSMRSDDRLRQIIIDYFQSVLVEV